MAEFVQMMKDWRRMCQHMEKMAGDRSCDICPLGGCNAIYEDDGNTDYAEIEEKVATWAAEHPEPVYPTWYEFMRENKIIPDVLEDCGDYYKTIGKWLVKATIKQDIAQKLGIEPKDG